MSDKKTPDKDPLEPSADEQNLLRILRKNPMMSDQIQAIANHFKQEVSDGMDAHQAEESLIKSLQELGVSMMGQWAQNTQETALEQALQDDPKLHKHSKKNSNGIPPSAP
jgi:hypothetical protein